ncbi:MAG: hypothetical protein HOB73_02410 [Planctomycetaceae bacterium]|jgi:hypothetical protein|nr:hypothetical protein [Planctomycetaceae bacterium]
MTRRRKILFSMIAFLFFYGLCELTFQSIGFDFSPTPRDLESVPTFYRIPTTPFGEAYYRRPGLTSWTGKVVTSQMQRIGYDAKWFPQEEEITLQYDKDGFRNPADLEDWEIVVIGDSFTELGNLKYEDLFSTRLGSLMGRSVKNLGISHTGVLNQIACLHHFGISESTKHVVWVFFEGNDVRDLGLELERLIRIRTGESEHVDLIAKNKQSQTSLTKAIRKMLFAPSRLDIYGPAVNATLSRGSESVRFKLDYTPVGSKTLESAGGQLRKAIGKLADLCRQRDLKLWCVYMPTKRRVFHSLQYQVDNDAAQHLRQSWQPSDLPRWLELQCWFKQIEFVDVTSSLIELNKSDEFSHNLVFDTHLSVAGARAVADSLAARMEPFFENGTSNDRPSTSVTTERTPTDTE